MSPTASSIASVLSLGAPVGEVLGGVLLDGKPLGVAAAEPLELGNAGAGAKRAVTSSARPTRMRAMIGSQPGRLRVSTMALGYPR
jgi:hypothetical protein